jgi:glycerol kinase
MREDALYLGLDQGGSSSKALLLEGNGQVYWQDMVAVNTIHRPEPDGEAVEHDPQEILESLFQLVRAAKRSAAGKEILGCGLSLQRSGVLAWQGGDKDLGATLCNIRTWRDSRNKNSIENLKIDTDNVKAISGLPLAYHFAASKIAELQKLYPTARVGTMDSWLINALGGRAEFWTEESHACRSQLYSLQDRAWSEDLCRIFNVDLKRRPQIQPSFGEFGNVAGIRISAILGDQQAALFGLDTRHPIINLGTLGQIIVPQSLRDFVVTDQGKSPRIVRGYNTGVSYSDGESGVAYQVEASINCCGSVLDQCAPKELAAELKYEDITDPKGVIFYPSLNTGSPDWTVGLSTWQEDLIAGTPKYNRALLENVAFWIALNLRNLKAEGVLAADTKFIYVLGGGSKSDYLVQAIASVSGMELRRLKEHQGSAFGAATGAFFAANNKFPELKLTEQYQAFNPIPGAILDRERTWNLLYAKAMGRG